MEYYAQETGEVLQELGSSQKGLTESEAECRLQKTGPNRLADAKTTPLALRLAKQASDPMTIVLIVSAVLSGIIGEAADMTVILLVVVLNAVLGVMQESKSEKAVEALQKITAAQSRVRRDGKIQTVDSHTLVPGDIVLLEAGDAVPADMRLTSAVSLKTDESTLTGESTSVEKTADALDGKGSISLGDRRNMAYMGSSAVYGRGEGVVTATGMQTEMGKISDTLAKAQKEATPLQQKLNQLSRVLSVGVLAVCAFVFVFSLLRNGDFSGKAVLDTFMLAISLAVAAVPEGLAAVVTIVLSIGVTNLSKRNAIVRRLTAVETLGCTQVICTDKTGTLTQNRMTVVETAGDAEPLARTMALCSDAWLSPDGKAGGEPTESALVAYAARQGIDKNRLEEKYRRVGEAPFDSERKMMSTVHENPEGGYLQYTKGAPDEILNRCEKVLEGGRILPLTDEKRRKIEQTNLGMAEKALRVLAAAYRPWDTLPGSFAPEKLETGLTFVGLAGMMDPVRPEVPAAVEKCRRAGIRPVMITGDHRDTAAAIAKELGIIQNFSETASGSDLDRLSDEELARRVPDYGVYARVQPEHKVRIVKAWKSRGMVTAMTGDGVNDAPALKTADIGTGMGVTGTDVAKGAADLILTDDNFATIITAVEEGRRIYDNIRKAIQFLLASNLSEVIAVFTATMLGAVLLKPIHILWINLVTDSIPAIALGMEQAEKGIMNRPPRPKSEGLFANGVGPDILYQGAVVALLTLVSYRIGRGTSILAGMTMAFLTLSLCEVFHAFNMRSRRQSIFTLHTRNRYLLLSLLFAVGITALMLYVPPLARAFSLAALSARLYFIALGLAFAIIPLVELVKLFQRKAKKGSEL